MASVLAFEGVAFCFDLHRLLGRRPQTVLRTVKSGWELVIAARQPAPDLVLLDQWMPDMLGDEILERLRRQPTLQHVPVILIGRGMGPEARARAERLGPVIIHTDDPTPETLAEEVLAQLKVQTQRQRRVAVRRPVELKIKGKPLQTFTRELSSFGAIVECEVPVARGERIEVGFLGDGARVAEAEAVVTGTGNAGTRLTAEIEFVEPSAGLNTFLHDALRDDGQLGSLIARIERLPALPSVAAKILEESLKPNVDLSNIVQLVRTDPALTAHLIKLANSAAFQVRTPVTTVDRAAVLLGMVAVRNAVLGIAIFRNLSQQAAGKRAEALWQHSVACGLACELLGPRFEVPKEEAFTLGLLHDVGKFVLLSEGKGMQAQTGPLTPERERELFGMDHAALGSAILARWRVPASLHEVVAHHHSDAAGVEMQIRKGAELVRAADAFVYSCHLGVENGVNDGQALLAARVKPEEMEGLRGKVFAALSQISAVFGRQVEPAELCAEIVERANQRLSTELRLAQEQNELLRRAYERSRQQLTSLVQSEKYQALGRIAAGVAHEINNPLAAASSNLQTLKQYAGTLAAVAQGQRVTGGPPLNEVLADLPEVLNETQEGLGRVRSVVEALRHFVPSGRATMVLASLHTCLEHALFLAGPSRPPGVSVEISQGKVRETLLDPHGMVRAFVEIILNAFTAMAKKGGKLSVDFSEDAQNVSIFFRDNGPGIPEEDIQHLFEPFFTTQPVGAGRGLGLSVAYGIVSRVNGQIVVSSTPNEGTVVEVRLPAPKS